MQKSLLWHQFSLLYPEIASTYLLNPSNIGFFSFLFASQQREEKLKKRILHASKSIINMRLRNFLSSSHFSLYLDNKKRKRKKERYILI